MDIKLIVGSTLFLCFLGYRILLYGIKLGYNHSQQQDTIELMQAVKAVKEQLPAPEHRGIDTLLSVLLKVPLPDEKKAEKEELDPNRRIKGFGG